MYRETRDSGPHELAVMGFDIPTLVFMNYGTDTKCWNVCRSSLVLCVARGKSIMRCRTQFYVDR